MFKNYKFLWEKNKRYVAILIIIVLFLMVVIFIFVGYLLNWIWTGFIQKTLWDWMQLLIIPVVLSIGGLLFSRRQQLNEQQRNEETQQEAMLQSYIDRMSKLISKLIIDNNLGDSNSSAAIRSIARALTMATAKRLNPQRKAFLIQFLHESGLIRNNKDGGIVDMTGVDLTKAELILVDLSNVDLRGANLREAVLHKVNLSHANLEKVCFCKAILSGSNFKAANLCKAHLERADLRYAKMSNANLTQMNAKKADLRHAVINNADFCNTDLTGASLSHANLAKTIFGILFDFACLDNTNFEGASVEEEYRELLTLFNINTENVKFVSGSEANTDGEEEEDMLI